MVRKPWNDIKDNHNKSHKESIDVEYFVILLPPWVVSVNIVRPCGQRAHCILRHTKHCMQILCKALK